jgi:hypothetical protein
MEPHKLNITFRSHYHLNALLSSARGFIGILKKIIITSLLVYKLQNILTSKENAATCKIKNERYSHWKIERC